MPLHGSRWQALRRQSHCQSAQVCGSAERFVASQQQQLEWPASVLLHINCCSSSDFAGEGAGGGSQETGDACRRCSAAAQCADPRLILMAHARRTRTARCSHCRRTLVSGTTSRRVTEWKSDNRAKVRACVHLPFRSRRARFSRSLRCRRLWRIHCGESNELHCGESSECSRMCARTSPHVVRVRESLWECGPLSRCGSAGTTAAMPLHGRPCPPGPPAAAECLSLWNCGSADSFVASQQQKPEWSSGNLGNFVDSKRVAAFGCLGMFQISCELYGSKVENYETRS